VEREESQNSSVINNNDDFMAQQNRDNFTQIPNCVIDNLTSQELLVYIMVKKHAGDEGESFVSNKTLEKKLKMSHNTITKVYGSLIKKKVITYCGEKQVSTIKGYRPVKVYKIQNIWDWNTSYYKVSVGTPKQVNGV